MERPSNGRKHLAYFASPVVVAANPIGFLGFRSSPMIYLAGAQTSQPKFSASPEILPQRKREMQKKVEVNYNRIMIKGRIINEKR